VRQTPILILAYNRADKVRGLVNALRAVAPPLVMLVVDGPKPGNSLDADRVQAVRDVAATIDWDATVLTRFRPVNLGLRASVTDAVSWAITEYGQVVVIEEDVVPGPDFLAYAEYMLDAYRDDARIAHISGYNVVPVSALGIPAAHNRLSRYPESIAWATWDRAWRHYDDSLVWPAGSANGALRRITGSGTGALRWRQNFADARSSRISTWAYRWIASMWSRDSYVLSPNVNLVTYVGRDEGTHTRTQPPWTELPLYSGPLARLLTKDADYDPRADAWVNRVVFRGTAFGVARGVLITIALDIRKRHRASRALRDSRNAA
jgi:hypothetical protein